MQPPRWGQMSPSCISKGEVTSLFSCQSPAGADMRFFSVGVLFQPEMGHVED